VRLLHPSRKLLDRTLLYTALTRARLQVVLVGDRRAYESAIQNPPNPSLRQTSIGAHLAHQLSPLTHLSLLGGSTTREAAPGLHRGQKVCPTRAMF